MDSGFSAIAGRDGLWQLFITHACVNCHLRDGRGVPPLHASEESTRLLLRLSSGEVYAYGDQIQNRAIPWAQPEACSTLQTICDDLVNGGDPELPDKQINLVIHYFQFLAVPSRRDTSLPEVKSGYQIFFERGCAGCCLPSLRTRADAFHPLFMD